MDKTISGSDRPQILILKFPIPRASLPLSPALSNFTLSNWNPSSIQSSSCSSSVLLFCSSSYDHTPPEVMDIPNHMPSQAIKFFIKLYADLNTLWVNHATHQKTESLWAASLSKLGNTFNNTLSSIQSMLDYLQNGRCSSIFITIIAHTTTLQSPPNIHSSTLVSFYLPILTLLIHSLPLYLRKFSPPCFCEKPSQQSAPKIFYLLQPFSQYRLL